MLQEGVFYQPGTRPPSNFGIMFLRVSEGVNAETVGNFLNQLWQIYQDLKQGKVQDLPDITIPPGNLNVSIGYGPKVFDLLDVKKVEPVGLAPRNRFRSIAPNGGNKLLRGGGLSYESGLNKNPASEEIMVQFLGDTPLVITRPMVETWKFLHNRKEPETGTSALEITAFYKGFHREDRRSWIDFHDGLSNPQKGLQREQVITIKEAGTPEIDAWTRGGTYMTFMRLPINLELWNRLSRQEQELLVGRDKVTGCALENVDEDDIKPVTGCPFHNTTEVTQSGNESFREPPDGVGEKLQKSHVQRANHHRQDFANPESLRIYRQGYEFVESIQNGIPRVGLNFVSFQDTPARVIEMLTRPGWLGGVNFGGELDTNPQLIQVASAGIYLLPPLKAREPFPGAEIFLKSQPS